MITNTTIREINKRNEMIVFTMETWEKCYQFYSKEPLDDNILEPLVAIKKACMELETYLMKTKPVI